MRAQEKEQRHCVTSQMVTRTTVTIAIWIAYATRMLRNRITAQPPESPLSTAS